MAWLSVGRKGEELIWEQKPKRAGSGWFRGLSWHEEQSGETNERVPLPAGTIEKLIGRALTWENDPIEITQAPSKGEG